MKLGIFAIFVIVGAALLILPLLNLNNVSIPNESPTITEPIGYINDSADIIGSDVEASLEADLKNFKPEIAVLTVKSMNGLAIEEYSMKIANEWKVGDADKDDGVILIVSTGERKVRIEVGYGSEGKINDAKAGRILDEKVLPYFKNGDWENGILEGVLAIKAALK